MAQFLFVVEVFTKARRRAEGAAALVSDDWSRFSSEAESIARSAKRDRRLAENVWLLDAENALPVLAALSSLATQYKLTSHTLLLPEGPIDIGAKPDRDFPLMAAKVEQMDLDP